MKHKKISRQIVESVRLFSNKNIIPLHEPSFNNDDLNSVSECLSSSYVSTASKFTNTFEEKIKKLTKSKYVVATINGTSALQVAIKSLGIKKNEEILIPNLNYVSSTNTAIYCNTIPHFVDVESLTFGIDVNKLEKYLKKISIIKKKNYNK